MSNVLGGSTQPLESFLAIDFETANSDRRSACAVGLALFENGSLGEVEKSLIKPLKGFDRFDPINISIHNITEDAVKDAPTFQDIWDKIIRLSSNLSLPLVCHGSGMDMRIIYSSLTELDIKYKKIWFYDTYSTFKKFKQGLFSYRLPNLCEEYGIELSHHDPLSDAVAAGKLALIQCETLKLDSLLDCASKYGFGLGSFEPGTYKSMSNSKKYYSDSSKRYNRKLSSFQPSKDAIYNEDLYLKKVVITGELEVMNRDKAHQLAKDNGAELRNSVSRKTDFLVIGKNSMEDLISGKPSRKLKNALELIRQGINVEIITEEQFYEMCHFNTWPIEQEKETSLEVRII